MIAISKKKISIALVILIACALLLLLVRTPPAEWDRAQLLGDYIESRGLLGVVVFFVLTVLATSIGLPRQFFAFASGFAYGVTEGVLLSSVAAIGGCALTFYCSRRWLSKRVQARFPSAVAGLDRLIRDDVFLKILVLRLQPLGTNLITNLCAGVTQISAARFFTSSWLGYLPQMLVFSLLGAGVRIGSNAYLMFSLTMLCLSLAIGLWLYKKTIKDPF